MISFTYDARGLVDDAGCHAWAELGVRSVDTGLDFNPYSPLRTVGWSYSCVATLYADQNIPVGYVTCTGDEETLVVEYAIDEPWLMLEAHLHVATSVDDIPQAKGNPVPGKFMKNLKYDPPVDGDTFTIDLSTVPGYDPGDTLYVAAHAVVGHTVSGCIDLYSDASTMVTAGNEESVTYPKPAVEVTGPWETIAGPMGFTTNSKWIWETTQVVHPITGDMVEFSKEFTINGLYLVDKTGSLYITADNGYEVSLNTGYIGRAQLAEDFRTAGNLKNDIVWWYDTYPPGPPANLPYGWATPETWDISDKLTLGLNTLAITGVNEYCDTDEYPYQVGTVDNNPAGVRYEAHICYTVVDYKETAWGEGTRFSGKNWATYMTCTPSPIQVAGSGVWLATDYDWTVNTFDPDPPGSPTLDLDDKLILQKAGGHGEGDYNLPSVPPAPGNNHRVWWDRDGVDPWQNPETANTGGIYQIEIHLHATSATEGTAYMKINGLWQGFETDGNWNTIELTPAGMTFTGDMKHLQVFYGLFGYDATHTVTFEDITVTQTLNS